MILAWLVTAFMFATHPPEGENVPRLDDIYGHFMYPGVEVTVGWYRCGAVNAYYDPTAKHVRMCVELVEEGVPVEAIRFMFAHEMGHAVIRQLDIPYVYSEEAATDELAAYVLHAAGKQSTIEAGADFFATKHMEGWRVHPLADHPDHLKRALTLQCYALGAEGNALGCPRDWHHMVRTWTRLLPTWEN